MKPPLIQPNSCQLWALLTLLGAASASAATVNWVGGSGEWNEPANWSTGSLPSPSDDVVIDVPGNISVTHSTDDHTVRSILCQEEFVLSGGTLTVLRTVQVNNELALSGGTLSKASILRATTAQVVVANGGVLDGVTLRGEVTVPSGQSLILTNGLTLLDGARVTLKNTTALYFSPGTQTLEGQGEIVMEDTTPTNFLSSILVYLGYGGESALTIGPHLTVRGRGRIVQSSPSTLLNQGTIQAEVSGGELSIALSSVTNIGTLRALGGTLSVSRLAAGAMGGTFELIGSGSDLTLEGYDY
ncbi:MAG TPA: hypothetical protein DCE44_22910, partial [Verrucomicrobiales bacterium]|nr:hypothetical protein [Verrucomicrobiales bacterium]